jgi:hypothetical protein
MHPVSYIKTLVIAAFPVIGSVEPMPQYAKSVGVQNFGNYR